MDCKIMFEKLMVRAALVYFPDTLHCNTVTLVELGCVFRNSLCNGPSRDEGKHIFV